MAEELAEDFDPASAVGNWQSSALSRVVGGLDQKPEASAKILQLSRATGTDPSVVALNPENFEQGHKADLATDIVSRNPHLMAYINGNPMAGQVSANDWGNLDDFTRSASTLRNIHDFISDRDPVKAGLIGMIEGAKEGFMAPLHRQEWFDELYNRSLSAWVAWQGLSIPVRLMNAAAEATFKGAGKFASTLAKDFGYDESAQASAEREARGIVESEMGRAGSHELPTKVNDGNFLRMKDTGDISKQVKEYTQAKQRLAQQMLEVHEAAKDWLDAGLEPPRGVHPLIDQAKEHLNDLYVDRLQDALEKASKSETRDIGIELFESLSKDIARDSSIEISGDRVVQLYGDKVPNPEDGLLGWVPGIETKLEAARATGTGVHVPWADWFAKADPQMAKELKDDIKAWPGGITKTEAKEPMEYKPVVDSPMAKVRANGLEPMFAIGDRKLTLEPSLKETDAVGLERHEYKFLDQDGNDVGFLELYPDEAKKQLYIGMIGGKAGLYSNSFGPSLIRDLKRQLKELYPEYETITGHRVTGARYADKWFNENLDQRNPTDHPVVKLSLDAPEDAHLGQLLDGLYTQQFSQGISAHMIPKRMWLENEHLINNAVQDVIRRMTGGSAEAIATHGIEHESIPGDFRGVYLGGEKTVPKILFDLMDPEAVGIARHEAIHHLYHSGLFTDAEWSALLKASEENKWRERYGIDKRYSEMGLDDLSLHEEAIAEAYREWAATKDKVSHPDSLVGMAFQKIHDLLEAIKERVKEILPWGGDVHELFEKVDTGEIGKRAGVEAEGAGPKFSLSPEDYQVKLDNLRAEAAGLDLKSWKKMQKLINERYAEELEAAYKRAEKQQKKEQTKEWKDQAKEIRKDAEESVRQRPEVAADLFVGAGVLRGVQLEKRLYSLRASDLTPEQQAELPRRYYSKEGLPIDAVANLFGFPSGNELVRSLSEYNATKEGRTVQEQLKKVTEDEVQRQMEAQYGKLDENIMLEARDQALSETNLNILADEYYGAAMQAGIETIDKDFAKTVAGQFISQMRNGDVDQIRLMNQMLKLGRDAERALIAGKPADAVRSMERKYLTGLMAAEAMKLEKDRKALDKIGQQFRKREVPSVDAEYNNHIHDILQRIGYKINRTPADIAKEIAAGESGKNLESFVASKQGDGRVMDVWEQLFDKDWAKDKAELTVDEFRAVKASIDTLVHNGRNEKKLYSAGKEADFAEIRERLIQGVVDSAFGETATHLRKISKLPMTYFVNHLQMENIFGRWDSFDSKGTWTQYVLRDLINSVNESDVMRSTVAKKIKALGTPEGIDRTIENNLFRNPATGDAIPFTRKNLLTVMLNMGNDYNMKRIAEGHGLQVPEVAEWVFKHARPDEWDFVQGIWDIFKELKDNSDRMYRHASGIAPKSIPVRPVLDLQGRQVAEGGYYPIIAHPEFEGTSKKLMGKDPLFFDNYTNTLPNAAHTKDRTGYVGPLSLDLDMMTNRMAQQIHETATREALINATKVFRDKEIRDAIYKHFGAEYRDGLLDWLRSIANSQNYIPKNQQAISVASEFIRQNMISTLIGFNPGTVMKHGPTAFGLSMKEIGAGDFIPKFFGVNSEKFAHWVKGLFNLNSETAETAWKFAVDNSLELQRRDRNWQESLYGVEAGLTPGDKYAPWRQRIMEWGSKPVALSDMMSAVPTWLAKYHEEIENGASHGDAVFEADRSVRRAHGSTASTNRTAIQRNVTPWLTAVYNFWSEIMNRQVETIWRAGEAAKLTDGGSLAKGLAWSKIVAGGAFAYVIWPAIVESMVSPEVHDEDDPWAKKAAIQLAFTLGSSWVGVRDMTHGLVSGRDPQFGLTGTAYQATTNWWRDIHKEDAFDESNRGKFLQDSAFFVGAMTGLMPLQAGRIMRFAHDVGTGEENPDNAWQWLVGARYGTTKKHSQSFEEYWKGEY